MKINKKNIKTITLNKYVEINGKEIMLQRCMGGRYFTAYAKIDEKTGKTLFTRATIDTAIAKINAYCAE